MRLFHLSPQNAKELTLTPKIPDNFMTKLGYENKTIPRISVAPTIENCILGIGFNRLKDSSRKYYVYEPIDYDSLSILTNAEIINRKLTPDSEITKEYWILKECNFTCIGYIEIISPQDKYESVFFDGKEITKQYYWNYEFHSLT